MKAHKIVVMANATSTTSLMKAVIKLQSLWKMGRPFATTAGSNHNCNSTTSRSLGTQNQFSGRGRISQRYNKRYAGQSNHNG